PAVIGSRAFDCVNHSSCSAVWGLKMRSIVRVAALAIGLAVSLAGAASAGSRDMLDKLQPQNLTAVLDALGLTYKVTTDPRGYPMVMVDPRRMPVAQFNILFFGCNARSECDDVSLWSWYDIKQPVSDKAIFAWNNPFGKSRRWSTGYLDVQNDPALVLNINATRGIGAEAVQILVNTYVQDIFDFRDATTGRAKTSANDAPAAPAGKGFGSVRAADLLPTDVRKMTNLVKTYGATSYA